MVDVVCGGAVVVVDCFLGGDVVVDDVGGAVVVVVAGGRPRTVVVVVDGAPPDGGKVVAGNDVVDPSSGSDDDVLDDVLDVDEPGAVDGVSLCRSSWSGVAVSSWRTGRPSCALVIASPKISAGYEPPVTGRPRNRLIDFLASGYPTHTPVASCGV